MQPSTKKILLILIFVVSTIYMGVIRLDQTSLWDDEAHISIVAKNFNQFGKLTGWDGRNLIGYRNGDFLDDNFITKNPPLDNLLAAASFRLFGTTTWAARLPFVVVGLLALPLLCAVTWHYLKSSQWLSIYCVALLGLSTVFLLNIRTCRYNAVTITCAALAYYAQLRFAQTRQKRYLAVLVFAFVVFFYANYMLSVVFAAALAFQFFVSHKATLKAADWKKIGAAVLAAALLTVPYALWWRIWAYPAQDPEAPFYIRKPLLMWMNLRDLNAGTFLPWMVVVGLIYFGWKNRDSDDEDTVAALQLAKQWGWLIAAYIVLLSLLSPQPAYLSPYADIRFLVPLIPFCMGLAGIFVWFIHRRAPVAAALLLVILVCTNALSLHPTFRFFGLLLPKYVQGLHQPYPTANQAVPEFLLAISKRNDTVYAYPDFLNLPLQFYAGDQVKVCCVLDKNTHLPKSKIEELNSPLYIEDNFPNWYIAFNMYSFKKQHVERLNYFSRRHKKDGKLIAYPYTLYKYLNINWDQTQRPELFWHSFGPITNFKPEEGVYIFKRGAPIILKEGQPAIQPPREGRNRP